jgi:ABC-type nitrate/sulfonate/bicarbonate transport system substrate-binding protein
MLVIGCLLGVVLSVAAETYTVTMLQEVGWAYYKVAEVKGFWQKQGVSVTLRHYTHPQEGIRAGIHRRIDLAPLPMAVIADFRENGGPDMTYLGSFSVSDFHKYLMLKNDLVNKSLKGQTIGVFANDQTNTFLIATYLKTVNTNLADVRLVELTPDELEVNFTNNRLQAALFIDQGNKFYEQADGVIVLSTHDFYEPHGLAVVKEGGVAAIPPDDLKKILRGIVEAIVWLRDPANWDEYKVILKKDILGRPDMTDDQLRAAIKSARILDPQALLEHNQQRLHDHFTEFRTFL